MVQWTQRLLSFGCPTLKVFYQTFMTLSTQGINIHKVTSSTTTPYKKVSSSLWQL